MNAKTPNRRFKASALAVALAGMTLSLSAQAAIIEIGDDAEAPPMSVAIGDQASATGLGAVALGYTANASGPQSVAIGWGATASGLHALALGQNASAAGEGSVAHGRQANASESGAIAIGSNTSAISSGAVAIGITAQGQGVNSIAIGSQTLANGDNSVAVGTRAEARGRQSSAFGASATASADYSSAIGALSYSSGSYSDAVGYLARATGFQSVALGANSQATEANTVSVGNNSLQRRVVNVGFGQNAHDVVVYQQVVPALSGLVSGLGGGATYDPATGVMTAPSYALSVGTFDNVGSALTAIDAALGGGGGGSTPSPYFKAQGTGQGGDDAQVAGGSNVAAGAHARAGEGATALGAETNASGNFSTAVGLKANSSGVSAVAIGDEANAAGDGSLALGPSSVADGDYSIALGALAESTGNRGVALGALAKANANCVTIGAGTSCDEDGTVSLGVEGWGARLVHVGAGVNDDDAVIVRQVAPIADAFGGGAGFANGQFVAPNYGFRDGTIHSNVGSAVDNLDARVWNLENNPGGGDGQGPQGPEGPQGPQGIQGIDGRSAYEVAVANGFEGNEQQWLESLQGRDGRDGVGGGSDVAAGRNIEVEDNGDGTRSVHLSDVVELSEEGRLAVGGTTVDAQGVRVQGGPSMTRQGLDAGNQRITGVAAGRIERGSTDAVNGGQLWQFQQDLNDRWDQIDNRMANMDRRLDGLCAMGQAQAQASMSSAHIKTRNRVAVGAGYCGSKTALSLGYSRDVTTPRGSPSAFSFGVSTTGQDTAIGAGWAIGW